MSSRSGSLTRELGGLSLGETNAPMAQRCIVFSQHSDERLVNSNQGETEVVSSTFFYGSVFFARVQTGVMPFSAWRGTLKLLMSSHFSRALVALLLLLSQHQTSCKYRPPVSKHSLTVTRGSALLLFSQRVNGLYVGSLWGVSSPRSRANYWYDLSN